MANVKIPDLTAASTPLAGTELVEIVQSNFSRKVFYTGSSIEHRVLSMDM